MSCHVDTNSTPAREKKHSRAVIFLYRPSPSTRHEQRGDLWADDGDFASEADPA